MKEHILRTIYCIAEGVVAWLHQVSGENCYNTTSEEEFLDGIAHAIEDDELDQVFPLPHVSELCYIL